MQAEMPRGPRRLNLAALTPSDFELLCFWVVGMTHADAIRTVAPDAGADAALRRKDGSWERCWQAKRFTGQVSWPQCKGSLDAAVKHYDGLTHYTFCFARDLTANQEALFTKRLIGRHPGLTVDHWGQSRLEGLLFGSEQGERIANHFFGDPTIDTKALMRAARAGGALETSADAIERLATVAEHFANDPLYHYTNAAAAGDAPLPGLTPETVISMLANDGKKQVRIDAVPRNPNLLIDPPATTVHMPTDRLEELELFRRRGGEFKVEGVKLELKNLPAAFREFAPTLDDDMTVVLSSPRILPRRWHARFRVVTAEIKIDPFEIQLEPTADVDEPWDAALVGADGGIEVRMLFQGSSEGGGSLTLNWTWKDDATRPSERRAHELAFVEALSGTGQLVIDDVNGERDILEFDLPQRGLDPSLLALRRFLENLSVVEERAGRRVTIEGQVPIEEVKAIGQVAHIIRTGESRMTFNHISMLVPPERVPEEREDGHALVIESDVVVSVLGIDLPVGRLRGHLEQAIAEVEAPDGDGNIMVTFTPTSEEAKHPVFTLRPYTEEERRERGLAPSTVT